ncbi:hypothetical protein [Winogradskyella sp. A3E31]|uniref:hypothetical protein n=1 Tax=Winogradskyella sp. A3E31 TaxID=3349637 RepID=UPI00398AFDC4
MIVNPQLFNYRLIIGSLITAITILSIFGVSNYNSLKSYEHFLEQEKGLIQTELSSLIDQYDTLSAQNAELSIEVKKAKSETEATLKQLLVAETNLEAISEIKYQLNAIRLKNKELYATIDSLKESNKILKSDNLLALNTLKKKESELLGLRKNNEALNSKINAASVLSLATITANAYKTTILGKTKETTKARSVNSIDVCMVLAHNPFVLPGKKEIYIQIVNPKNNVIADKGSVTFGNSTLIYSDKQIINYTNENLDMCTKVEGSENDKPFLKGLYYINVFYKDQKLGSTTFTLN